MKTYALVVDGNVQEILTTDDDITKMFHPSLVWIDVTEIEPQPQENWVAVETAGAWTFTARTEPLGVE